MLHSRLAGDTPIYNEPITLGRHGQLDREALERSFTEVVRRHEAWRTTFAWEGDHAVQIVQPAPEEIVFPFVDLSAHVEAKREAFELATTDARKPFDLTRGPLYRPLLVSLGHNEHLLFLTLHHIIFDGVSLYRVFVPELLSYYSAFTKNEKLSLGELPIQYADYAKWQRDGVREISPEQLSYWRPICTDAPVLNLPTDRPRPATQSYAGAVEPIEVSATTSAALKALSQEQNTTSFVTLVAAFFTLLHGYTGDEDIVIGGVSSGRHHSETMGLLGCFLNTIPIRCAFAKDQLFTELLARVRTATLGALSHDEVPFELLVQKFAQARDRSRAPLAQVLIVVEPPLETLPEGWEFSHLDVHTSTAKFDLQLGLEDRPEGLRGQFIYNSDLFAPATITQLKERWLQLLAAIAASPAQSIGGLTSAVWNQENPRACPPSEWNRTQTNYPRNASIPQLFEQQARLTPSAVAAVFGAAKITYAELNRRANRLARRLERSGVSRDVPVGICLERSLEMIIALLAVLKAGGAYVPLDPKYPAERLAWMIADTQAPLVLAQRSFTQALSNSELLFVDSLDLSDENEADIPSASRAEDLAYIIYTSGSTGVPKGVAIPHRGVVRLVRNTSYASFSADETFLQLAPLSFDASTFEIWGALLNGGRLVVMPPAAPSLEEIGKAIREHSVTTLWLTSALFHAMVDERLADLQPLRQLLAGGDVLSVSHMRKAFAALQNTRLINGYGPTESTTFACCQTVNAEALRGETLPIGKPIANTTAHILDAKLEPVSIGASGELHLGGDGLARGYWRREELTLARFTPDRFSSNQSARLYKTGDLARWRVDGTIEFLGRIDGQLKLRGFRIEPGEIEAALRKQAGVLDSAVIVREDRPNEKRLVAYVRCEKEALESFDASMVTAALQQSLPDYLVPNAIVPLAALPRTTNGKLDRNALPAPQTRGDFAAPATPLERTLGAIWANVLGVERVGLHDNFFELGGHSLLALRLLNQVREQWGCGLPLTALFEAPTIAEFAATLSSFEPASAAAAFAPIVAVDRQSRRARRD